MSMYNSGEYVQNLCPANNPSCAPCPKRLPSCITLPDNQEAFPGKLWQADYIVCDTNRTMNITTCPQGEYFNPRLKKCMKAVPKGYLFLGVIFAVFYNFIGINIIHCFRTL